MAQAVDFPGTNKVLNAAPGTEHEVNSGLLVFNNGRSTITCWQLDEDEIAEVLKTGRIFTSVLCGPSQPPMFVGSEANVREVNADLGLWKKQP